jgi:hypothetical protein
MNTWVLLERAENLLPRVYQLVDTPQLAMLFDKTELAPYAGQSPVLVTCGERSDLLKAVRQSPKDWPGLILQSDQPTAVVLAHLRQIMFVHFDGARRGVLRYSHPVTASYFFPVCGAHQLKSWLGPVTRLSWYGGTWADRASNTSAWKTLENPKENNAQAFASDPVLDTDQQQALRCQQLDHLLYLWWFSHQDLCFKRSQQWLDEGLRLGFDEACSLERYLTLRSVYPASDLPGALPEGSDESRFACLLDHLQKQPLGQDSLDVL